jgi:predicted outer membrane protein
VLARIRELYAIEVEISRASRRISTQVQPARSRAAKLALRKSRNPEVRKFANEMIRDHTAVNRQAPGAGEEAECYSEAKRH